MVITAENAPPAGAANCAFTADDDHVTYIAAEQQGQENQIEWNTSNYLAKVCDVRRCASVRRDAQTEPVIIVTQIVAWRFKQLVRRAKSGL